MSPTGHVEKQSSNRLKQLFRKKIPDEEVALDALHPPTGEDTIPIPVKDKKNEPPPVSFFTLFRFHTKWDLLLNAIGVGCAIGAGSAQPLLGLVLGSLAKSFVDFGGTVTGGGTSITVDPETIQSALNHFKDASAKYSLILTGIGSGLALIVWFFMYAWTITGEKNSKRIREQYLKAVLRQEIAYFDTSGAGEVTTRLQSDTDLVQQAISEKVTLAIMFICQFISGFALAFARSWRLALALSSILPCITITAAVMNVFVTKWTKLSLKHSGDGGTLAEEVISTIRTAHAFGTQEKLADLYDQHVSKGQEADVKAAIIQGAGIGLLFFFVYCADALSFYFGTTLVLANKANVGIIVNVFYAILIGAFALAVAAPQVQAVVKGCAAAGRLFETIDRVSAIDSLSTAGLRPQPSSLKGTLTFEHVDFNYPSRPTVSILKDLNLTFEAGKTTALVGPSGCGKSSIINLIERFYDPLSGEVKLDGISLKDLNIGWLRTQIGLVAQEPVLFSASIRENVAHGLLGSRFEELSTAEKEKMIIRACKTANADRFINQLPHGFDTLVGERGYLLSGGQKQRIAIARAIVAEPPILLLDEATSALDTESEGIVQNALEKAAAGRTTVMIAHRLSTVRNADRIIVMAEGKLLEQGSHSELVSNPEGIYHRLVSSQKLRNDNGMDDIEKHADFTAIDDEKRRSITSPLMLRRATTDYPAKSGQLDSKALAGGSDDQPTAAVTYSVGYLLSRFVRFNRASWKSYAVGLFAAASAGCIYPGFGIVYANAVTSFQLNPEDPHSRGALRHDGNRNALYFFIVAIATLLVTTFQNVLFTQTAATLGARLRALCFRALLRQDVEYFDMESHHTGSLTADLSGNSQKIQSFSGLALSAVMQGIACILAGSIIGLAYAPKLAAVGIACIPFILFGGYAQIQVFLFRDKANKQAHQEAANTACEAVGSIRTVVLLTRENDVCRIYKEKLDGPLRRTLRTAVWSSAGFAVGQAMSFYAISLVSWYGSRLIADGTYDTKRYFVCLMSVTFGASQTAGLFQFISDLSALIVAGNDVIALLDSKPHIDSQATDGIVLTSVNGQVEMEDAYFEYPSRPHIPVLQGMTVTAPAGKHVALVGSSGCGKSTIVQLVERFYDTPKGSVQLDGHRIEKLNVKRYRENLAMVSQEPTLYAGTIRFNILLGSVKLEKYVTQEELETVCRHANILEFIQSLPDGFETQVGGKGTQLSGGQKQRIAIARALIRNPKVLLLDEATSALDTESEQVVQDALDRAAKGRTTITIAHRLSTIQNADCIYYIKDGKVIESGSHDQLMAIRGAYYDSTQLQQLTTT